MGEVGGPWVKYDSARGPKKKKGGLIPAYENCGHGLKKAIRNSLTVCRPMPQKITVLRQPTLDARGRCFILDSSIKNIKR